MLSTLKYTLGITSSYSENYNIKQSLIPGLPYIANLYVPGFCKTDRGHRIHLHNTRIVSPKSRQRKPYMNRIIRRRYQLSSILFFYPEDGDIIFLLNVGKFLRYIPEDSLLYSVLFCLQMGLPPNELSVPIQGTSIFQLRMKNGSVEVMQSVSCDTVAQKDLCSICMEELLESRRLGRNARCQFNTSSLFPPRSVLL